MKVILASILLCAIAAPWWVTHAARSFAQSATPIEWWIDVSRGRAARLAVEDFHAVTDLSVADARVLSEVVRADLEFASLRLIPREQHALVKQDARSPNYYGWESIGADLVVRGTAEVQDGRLVSEIRIDAVKEKQTIFATRYEGGRSPRDLAHRIADDFRVRR